MPALIDSLVWLQLPPWHAVGWSRGGTDNQGVVLTLLQVTREKAK